MYNHTKDTDHMDAYEYFGTTFTDNSVTSEYILTLAISKCALMCHGFHKVLLKIYEVMCLYNAVVCVK